MDDAIKRANSAVTNFFRLESAGGLVLMGAAAAALIVSNSPLVGAYRDFITLPVSVQIGTLALAKPLLLWINDGLMAVFFLLVGLEIKREVLEGELSLPSQIMLPVGAAVGGMVAPACIYLLLNYGDAIALRGWAIPTATDIAFALGILALLGNRVPVSLKVLLTGIAIADDLGAIVVIAIFYSSDLSAQMLILASLAIAILIALNLLGVRSLAAYVIVGIALWIFVLKSGVHATLAGVILAFAIPHRADAERGSLLRQVEQGLHPWVAFGVLPVFAFANAGVPLAGVTFPMLLEPLPLGILLGLVLGKLVGVYGTSVALIKFRFAEMPAGAGHLALMGTALLCGVGFTMSLFIGALAFGDAGSGYVQTVRLGVLTGSTLAAFAGYALLRAATGVRAAS